MCAASFVLLMATIASAGALLGDDRVRELARLRAASSDGVIELQDSSLESLILGRSGLGRGFYILFFDSSAASGRDEFFQSEFSSLAYSFLKNHAGSTSIFFASMQASKSPPVALHSFNVTGFHIPCVLYLPPSGGGIEILPRSSTAQQLALTIRSKSGIEIGEIFSPPLSTGRRIALACTAVILACLSPAALKAPFLQDPKIWCGAAITLYIFVISGGIFSILYQVPLIHPRSGHAFHREPDGQFGAEGILVASLYAVPSVAISVIVHWLPRVPSRVMPALAIMGVASCCALGCLSRLHEWKTRRS
ncbi:hypothetical protein SELMODRAFT_422308 [Selaginella moellendorffii]|uniref:Dolichyl-diphosphooligosaccharide--protein glycosyltransferase subunit 3 n=2 Tax=Selaginella moellendorffii TaxID=88036 RepID=D8SI03_SELML|nr:hypothetical protein SELMODRAFT_422308 [Selaginella moellendorffii]